MNNNDNETTDRITPDEDGYRARQRAYWLAEERHCRALELHDLAALCAEHARAWLPVEAWGREVAAA